MEDASKIGLPIVLGVVTMSRRSSLLLLAAIALAPALAQEKPAEKAAGTPAQQSAPKPAEKSPSATQDFSKEAYIIERLATHIVAENDGTGTRELTAQVKVLAEAGVKAFAVLNLVYTSANEAVEIDYVRVRKPDGTVVKTPEYNIQDMPGEVTRTAPLYSDIHEKHLAVKGLSVGDELEYLVRSRVFKPEVPGQFWYEYSFTKSAVAKDEQREISLPAEKYVKAVSPEFKPEVKTEGARRIYRWTHQNLTVKEKDPDEPPRGIPPNPDVQVTTFASWEDVGRWYGGVQKDPLTVTPAIQSKADELTKGLKTDEEKIHVIYNFVALKFHYIGQDFGIGRYQPHAADDVLDNGYGDCKDKHTLLASLLKAEGIEAWPALIHASRKLDPEVPSPAQFNHVITVVPTAGQFVWLDTTPEVAPYGLLLTLLRDKQALVIPTDKPPQLMTTPANPPFPSDQEFSMAGQLSASGTVTGHVEQSYRGDAEVVLRIAFRQLSESQWRDAVQRMSYGLNFGGEVSNVKVTPPDEIDRPLEISYDYVRKKYGNWDERQITAPLPPMGIEVAKDAHDKKPEEPVLLGALGKVVYRSQLELPEGYTLQIPAPLHLSEPYAEYDDTPRLEHNVLTSTRQLVIKKNEVPLAEWDGFRKFGRSLYDDEFNFMRLDGPSATVMGKADNPNTDDEDKNLSLDDMFSEGASALQRRDFRRAQQLNERVVAKDPKYKGAHFQSGCGSAGPEQSGRSVKGISRRAGNLTYRRAQLPDSSRLSHTDGAQRRSCRRVAQVAKSGSVKLDGRVSAGRAALPGGKVQRGSGGAGAGGQSGVGQFGPPHAIEHSLHQGRTERQRSRRLRKSSGAEGRRSGRFEQCRVDADGQQAQPRPGAAIRRKRNQEAGRARAGREFERREIARDLRAIAHVGHAGLGVLSAGLHEACRKPDSSGVVAGRA